MFKVIALAAAIAASASVAAAQGTATVAKSTAKVPSTKSTAAKATTPKRHGATKKESQSALRKEAKISEATARATALKEVPNGKVKSSELERENGKLIYSFDIVVPGKTGVEEVNIDAVDGSVVAHEHESAKTEKKEAATDSKAKK
jgi:uncharacterized membrane protein YkoI